MKPVHQRKLMALVEGQALGRTGAGAKNEAPGTGDATSMSTTEAQFMVSGCVGQHYGERNKCLVRSFNAHLTLTLTLTPIVALNLDLTLASTLNLITGRVQCVRGVEANS